MKISFWIVEDTDDPVNGVYAVCDNEEAAEQAVDVLMKYMGYEEYTDSDVSGAGIHIRPWNFPVNTVSLDGTMHPLCGGEPAWNAPEGYRDTGTEEDSHER
jgi:hypothetical protein